MSGRGYAHFRSLPPTNSFPFLLVARAFTQLRLMQERLEGVKRRSHWKHCQPSIASLSQKKEYHDKNLNVPHSLSPILLTQRNPATRGNVKKPKTQPPPKPPRLTQEPQTPSSPNSQPNPSSYPSTSSSRPPSSPWQPPRPRRPRPRTSPTSPRTRSRRRPRPTRSATTCCARTP